MRSLALVFALCGEQLDLAHTAQEYLRPGCLSTRSDLLRIGRAKGFKVRTARSSVGRIDAVPLPAIALHQDGSFFVIGRRTESGVLVGISGGPPTSWTIEELAANWSGDLIFAVRRDRHASTAKSFGIGWFLPVIKRFSRVLAEVLLVSVFIQLIGLIAPLFTQVTIDKVLVHRGLTTLEVLVIGLVVINVADVLLNWLRTYTPLPTRPVAWMRSSARSCSDT